MNTAVATRMAVPSWGRALAGPVSFCDGSWSSPAPILQMSKVRVGETRGLLRALLAERWPGPDLDPALWLPVSGDKRQGQGRATPAPSASSPFPCSCGRFAPSQALRWLFAHLCPSPLSLPACVTQVRGHRPVRLCHLGACAQTWGLPALTRPVFPQRLEMGSLAPIP